MCAEKTRQETRQDMYKYYSRSPCWKERFRRRCLERLKESRGLQQQLLRRLPTSLSETEENNTDDAGLGCERKPQEERVGEGDTEESRHDIEMIMREEFDRLKGEVMEERSGSGDSTVTVEAGFVCDVKGQGDGCSKNFRSVSQDVCEAMTGSRTQAGGAHSDMQEDSFVNELDSWYEEIYETLRKELEEAQKKDNERRLQKACDEHIRNEEEEICSGLQALSTDEIICPLCEKFNLTEKRNIIMCQCGLRINVEQDSVSLKYVRESLVVGTEEHSNKCECKPSFSLNQKFGISNLLMSCQECDFLFVIV